MPDQVERVVLVPPVVQVRRVDQALQVLAPEPEPEPERVPQRPVLRPVVLAALQWASPPRQSGLVQLRVVAGVVAHRQLLVRRVRSNRSQRRFLKKPPSLWPGIFFALVICREV